MLTRRDMIASTAALAAGGVLFSKTGRLLAADVPGAEYKLAIARYKPAIASRRPDEIASTSRR